MSQFFKFVFASCLGVILASVVLTGLSIAIATGLASRSGKKPDIKSNSVLYLKFQEPIPERTNNVPFDFSAINTDDVPGLYDIVDAIEAAADDDDIKGIYIDPSTLVSRQVTRSIIRDALIEFKKSGKFVVAYAPYYSNSAYHLASVADQIYVHPLGSLDFNGYAAFTPFMKEMFDKLGIKWNIFYAGKFKSATEPFRRTEMSDESRMQMREYLEGLYQDYLTDVSQERNVAVAKLEEYARAYSINTAQDAVNSGLIDQIGYTTDAENYIRDQIGIDRDDKIQAVSIANYVNAHSKKDNLKANNRIAVIYAEGSIVDGEGDLGEIGAKKYVNIIQKIRRKKNVSGIVMRINSGGGSALASEDIWHELMLAKEQGIPVTVSMGDYAASGGYYIAAAADSIFANESTLTGSIGVFSMMPNVSELMDRHLGIYMDTVKTTPMADGLNPFHDLSPQKERVLQNMTDRMYATFKQRVAEGRNMTLDQVEEIAQGRVWTGERAEELGLVDELGDLDRAITSVAHIAGLEADNYRIREYPIVKNPLEQLMEEFMKDSPTISNWLMRKKLGKHAPLYDALQEVIELEGPQARLPFVLIEE